MKSKKREYVAKWDALDKLFSPDILTLTEARRIQKTYKSIDIYRLVEVHPAKKRGKG